MATNYAVAMAVGIRRQRDLDRRSVSLERLLREIEEKTNSHPRVLSRESFLKNYAPELQATGDAEFDRLIGARATHVDPASVRRDLDSLIAATEKVKHYVNKRIAHRDEKLEPKARFGDIDESLDALERLVDKYCRLVTGGATRLNPTLPSGWKRIFHIQWSD